MIKRMTACLLVLFILTGCADKKTKKPETPEQPTVGWHEQNAQIELNTNGAIRSYPVQTAGPVTALEMVGDRLLLIEEGEQIRLTVLEGPEGAFVSQISLDQDAVGLQTIYNALAYYKQDTKETVFLDQNLETINRIKLPEEAEGVPVIAPDSSQIYYCVGQQIKAYDTSLNISRPVRSHSCKSQELMEIFFGGAVLSCKLLLEDGGESIVYISAETGQLLQKDGGISALETDQTQYVAIRKDGMIRQQPFGTLEGMPANMDIPQDVAVFPALDAGGFVTCSEQGEGNADLAFYDTETGKITAQISLTDAGNILDVCADEQGIWLLAETEAGQLLYYWTLSLSQTDGETVYTTPLYTAENPDEAGIAACDDRADDIAAGHYVYIRVWEDATYSPDGYTLTGEYQTEAINKALDELEQALAIYPDRFLYRCATGSLRINIVRSVSGGLSSLQFRRNADPYIVLTADCDVQDEFHKMMGYVINSRVLAKSPLFDHWDELNPEGFVYGETVDESYLSGDSRAFADAASMQSVTDDRSLLFRYAVQSDNSAMFQSPVMQNKLRQLCLGIRDAWGWEDKTETFAWEQYLTEPLVPLS